jgi:alanyl-tRNA synthetase
VYLTSAGVCKTDQSRKYVEHQKPLATVKAIFTGAPDYKFVDEISGDETVGVVLDLTSFYATSGGQVNDTGAFVIEGKNGDDDEVLFQVANTQENGKFILHIGACAAGKTLKVGQQINCSVDYERRALIAPNHTMTHVLNFALRKVRFDFAASSFTPRLLFHKPSFF